MIKTFEFGRRMAVVKTRLLYTLMCLKWKNLLQEVILCCGA